MAVLQMQKISICALKRDRKAILELLQSQGVMEVSQVKDDEGMLSRMDTVSYTHLPWEDRVAEMKSQMFFSSSTINMDVLCVTFSFLLR